MNEHLHYQNPLSGRYASPIMNQLWSEQRKFSTWRRLWVALAEAEQELGLPIETSQIDEMRSHLDDIDFAQATEYERRFRHDVMAHVHTFGEAAPSAKGVIHLGATSCYVTDNTDLILIREALEILCRRLAVVMANLARFAKSHRDLPTLGFTHFQAAQLTTVGKRATLWLHDLLMDLEELELRRDGLALRGVKGTTGTQASFLALFDGDHEKVKELDRRVANKLGFERTYPVTGQTYSRKVDSQILAALSGICQSAHKFATDVRLLSHRKEIEEPFESEQIGSSAMAYKRNPMRCERICGLARFVMSLAANGEHTEATQWLERTLDDSANRRLSIPQAFLGTDAVLRIYANVTAGLVVYPKVIARGVEAELPFMATENIMMAAVRAGGNRQELHEAIRRHSVEAGLQVKREGLENDLIDRLMKDPSFAKVPWETVLNSRDYVGRAPEQVDEFIESAVEPALARYRDLLPDDTALNV